MKITYVIEETPLGTAGALKNVEQYITGPFFVLNGDILTSLDLARDDGGTTSAKAASVLLHLIRVDDPSAFGCVVHDANGRISAFVEKPPQAKRADQRNQRRHVSVRTRDPRFDSRRAQRLDRTRNVSADHRERQRPLRLHDRAIIGSISAGPSNISPRTATSSRAACRCSSSNPARPAKARERCANVAKLAPPVHADAGVASTRRAEIGPNVVLGEGCTHRCRRDRARQSVLWDGVIIEDGRDRSRGRSSPAARESVAGPRSDAGSVIGHDAVVAPGEVLGPRQPRRRLGPDHPVGKRGLRRNGRAGNALHRWRAQELPHDASCYSGSYPPRECGIATFTQDVVDVVRSAPSASRADVIAIDEPGGEVRRYPAEVVARICESKTATATRRSLASSTAIRPISSTFSTSTDSSAANAANGSIDLLDAVRKAGRPDDAHRAARARRT